MDNIWDHAQAISIISIYLVTLEFIISKTLSCNFVCFSVTGSSVAGLSCLVMNLLFGLKKLFLMITFILSLSIHYIYFCVKIYLSPSFSHLLSMAHDKITQIEEIIVKERWPCTAYGTDWLWLCHVSSLIYFLLCKLRIGDAASWVEEVINILVLLVLIQMSRFWELQNAS